MLAPAEYERGAVRGYLDTATYGLPSRSVVAACEHTLADWRARRDWLAWEDEAERCRRLFAGLVGAEEQDVAITTSVSVSAGVVAASLPAAHGDNVVVHERDFVSNLFPWAALAGRGVDVRARALERLSDGVDERTALVAVSSVQSADGRVADLDVLKGGPRLFIDATHSVGALPVDVAGIDYLACSAYKWIPSPRGLSFLYVRRERLEEIEPWLAGWRARADWRGRYYGLPRDLAGDAKRLDLGLPWLVVPGTRAALELLAEVGVERIAAHDLRLARAFCEQAGLPRPAAPIVRLEVADTDAALAGLQGAGVSASARAGSVRLSFHLYNEDEDVALALEALAPFAVFDPQSQTARIHG